MSNDEFWPPRYVNVPVRMVKNDLVTDGAFKFYCKLLALAKGRKSLTIGLADLLALTSLSRTRVYEYARLLRLCNALLWRCSDKAFECSFTEDSQPSEQQSRISGNPKNRDGSSFKESINESINDPKKNAVPQSGISGFPKNGEWHPPQLVVYERNGGRFPTGIHYATKKLKKAIAIDYIIANVANTPSSLELWGRVVCEYTRQWSNASYKTMIDEYYLKGKVPGEPNGNHQTRHRAPTPVTRSAGLHGQDQAGHAAGSRYHVDPDLPEEPAR